MCLEASEHVCSTFLTLTYADDALPEKLDYDDIRTFLKRLRRNTPQRVRYFCCGEYGSKTGRPHWHLMLYGVPTLAKGHCHIKQWPHGGAYVGDVTPKSAAYVARYSLKSGKHGDRNVVQMSRRPGLGIPRLGAIAEYLATRQKEIDYTPHWLRNDGRLYPLDRTAREKFTERYTASGGFVREQTRSPVGLDFEARLIAIVGDPLSADVSAFRVMHMDREVLENATF